eukprot:1867867-Alexandrium_andersonii.AAC.1
MRPSSCGKAREATRAAPAAASAGDASQNQLASSIPAKVPAACGGCKATRAHRCECIQAARSQNAQRTNCL